MQTLAASVQITTDLEYGVRDGQSLQLDLYRPVAEGPVPRVVYFHGGAWMAGDRKAGAPERLSPVVERGLAVASVSYRFTNVATHPAQLQDGRDAIDWLVTHAREPGLSPGPVGVWGASAGGWIALMQVLGGHEGRSRSVAAACAWFPVTDLEHNIPDRERACLPLPPIMNGMSLPTPSMEARLLGSATSRTLPCRREPQVPSPTPPTFRVRFCSCTATTTA
jgi:acetyl esterase/lipase